MIFLFFPPRPWGLRKCKEIEEDVENEMMIDDCTGALYIQLWDDQSQVSSSTMHTLQYLQCPDVYVANRCNVFDLCNDNMIRRNSLVFSAALLC